MGKNKVLVPILGLVLLMVIFLGLAFQMAKIEDNRGKASLESSENQSATVKAEDNTKESKLDPKEESEKNQSESKQKTEAEALIGEKITQDEIQNKVGKWNDFEMSSESCERGVYAGKFFYNSFIIHTRTYDQGQTFNVVSVN